MSRKEVKNSSSVRKCVFFSEEAEVYEVSPFRSFGSLRVSFDSATRRCIQARANLEKAKRKESVCLTVKIHFEEKREPVAAHNLH